MRTVFFFADVPHLTKTARNCLSNSGSGHATRFMRNHGPYILRSHNSVFYFQDLDSVIKMLSKLTSDHFNLTPFSFMRVHLAAQVLSITVEYAWKNLDHLNLLENFVSSWINSLIALM